MDKDDIEQSKFLAFIAAKVGTYDWYIIEPGEWKRTMESIGLGLTGISRKQFEKYRAEYQEKVNA